MGAETSTLSETGRDMRLTTDLHLIQGLRNFYRLYIQFPIRLRGVYMDNAPFALRDSCPLQLVQCCGTEYSVCCENHTRRTETQSDKMNVAARGTYNYQPISRRRSNLRLKFIYIIYQDSVRPSQGTNVTSIPHNTTL